MISNVPSVCAYFIVLFNSELTFYNFPYLQESESNNPKKLNKGGKENAMYTVNPKSKFEAAADDTIPKKLNPKSIPKTNQIHVNGKKIQKRRVLPNKRTSLK